eukprot:SAG22_NODE_555_length_9124_cov_114.706593_7_plen_792_part_00
MLPLRLNPPTVAASGGAAAKAAGPSSKLKLALIGPHANSTNDLLGYSDYYAANDVVTSTSSGSVLQILTREAAAKGSQIELSYALGATMGCGDGDDPHEDCVKLPPESERAAMRAGAVKAAQAADVVLLMLGINGEFEDEGHDRWQIGLPGSVNTKFDHGAQLQLAEAVMALRKPTVAVVLHGGSLAIEPLLSADAIIDAHYPGEFGGRAIVDAIWGRANRFGRLSATLYPANYTEERNMSTMDLQAGPGATYWYYRTPLFAFGSGMSYTSFTYHWTDQDNATSVADAVELDTSDVFGAPVQFECTVTNTGCREGDAVVLGFIASSQPGSPVRRLFDFARVKMAAGESQTIVLLAQADSFALGDDDGLLSLRAGEYHVEVGDTVAPARKAVRLRGADQVVEDYRDYFALQKSKKKRMRQQDGQEKGEKEKKQKSESARDLSAKTTDDADGDGNDGVARLLMVSCASAQALNLSAAAVKRHKPGVLQVAGTKTCVTIHNTTMPGTCSDAVGVACSLVLQPCDTRAAATQQWEFQSPGHLCTAASTKGGKGSDCADRAHIASDFTTLHVSLYTTRPGNHMWHLAPTAAGLLQLVSNCTDAVCAPVQCVGMPSAKTDDNEQQHQRPTTCLDGEWEFSLDAERKGWAAGWSTGEHPLPHRCTVPGAWEADGFGNETAHLWRSFQPTNDTLASLYPALSLPDIPLGGLGWYKKNVALPPAPAGNRLFLRVGGVHRSVTAFANGVLLGHHSGYLHELEWDITAAAAKKQDGGVVVVLAVDSYHNMSTDPLMGSFDMG